MAIVQKLLHYLCCDRCSKEYPNGHLTVKQVKLAAISAGWSINMDGCLCWQCLKDDREAGTRGL